MWPFSKPKRNPPPYVFSTHAELARKIHMGTGLQMLVEDNTNRIMRHCRLGRIKPKRHPA